MIHLTVTSLMKPAGSNWNICTNMNLWLEATGFDLTSRLGSYYKSYHTRNPPNWAWHGFDNDEPLIEEFVQVESTNSIHIASTNLIDCTNPPLYTNHPLQVQ